MSKKRSGACRAQQRMAAENEGAMTVLEHGFAYFQFKVAQRLQAKRADKAFRAMLGCGPAPDEPCWPLTLAELIGQSIELEPHDESDEVRAVYEHADAAQRNAIDCVFKHLCGWKLQTLIEEGDELSGRLGPGHRSVFDAKSRGDQDRSARR
jgi:hypothetical protein